MTQELIVAESKPQSLYRVATDAAGLCKDIVLKTAVRISGRKYVRCEGWMAIATAHGCIASSLDVAKVDGGYVAKGVIRRMSDGAVLSEAQGFVGLDESAWKTRPEYACRAMAQTRAISRACRAAFAHVVVLIDSDLSTTPAEEVPAEGFDDAQPAPAPAPRPVEIVPAFSPAPVARPSANVVVSPVTTDAKDIFGIIRKIATKPTSNGGTRYGILIEPAGEGTGVWLNTFDDVAGALAKSLEGSSITAQYKEGKYGKDLVSGSLQEDMP